MKTTLLIVDMRILIGLNSSGSSLRNFRHEANRFVEAMRISDNAKRQRRSNPPLELAHRESCDQEHACFAVIKAGYSGKIFATVALENVRSL